MENNAADMLQFVLEGSFLMNDKDVGRRPYHKNCGCALHKLKRDGVGVGSASAPCMHQRMVSFTKRLSWRDCCLSMKASKFSTKHSVPVGEHWNGIEMEKISPELSEK